MSDVLFLALTVVAFTVAWGLVVGCERLLGADDEPFRDEASDGRADEAVPVCAP